MGRNNTTIAGEQGGKTPGVVLLVGEQGAGRERLRHIVEKHLGVRNVLEADSLEAAPRLIAEGGVSLAIVDLGTAKLPPPSVLARLHAGQAGLKLVIAAAALDRDMLAYSLAAGAQGCVLKDGLEEEMAQDIGRVMGGELVMAELFRGGAGHHPGPGGVASFDDIIARLTPRQQTVLSLLERGMTNKQMSRELGITARTVKMHLSAVYRALGVQNRTQALAVILGLRGR